MSYRKEALRRVMEQEVREQLHNLDFIDDWFREINVIATARKPEALTSVLRQSFITLMAVFDATVFDLVKAALRTRFFELAHAFSDDKIQIKAIVAQGSFAAFRDWIIDEQLRHMYIKELLRHLEKTWRVTLVDSSVGDKHEHLTEIINRRNIHIHKRGVVDSVYLEMNIHGLEDGGYAAINEEYWQFTKRLTSYCVKEVAAWARRPSSPTTTH